MKGKEIQITHRPFTDEWWKGFMEETSDMTKSLIIKGVLSSDEIGHLYNDVRDVISNSPATNNFRIYINHVLQNNEWMNDCRFLEGENIKGWVQRIFPSDKFSIIINQCEQLSLCLSQLLFRYLERLNAVTGIPLMGYNSTIFMGNYGFTPLGIHHDGTGNNVLHFHIGPGDKTMYNWDADKYTKEIAGLPFEEQLAAADQYNFSAGDLYFMPWDKYHIGNTEDFSIGITLWFNNPTKTSYLKKLNDDFLIDLIEDAEAVMTPITGAEQKGNDALFSLVSRLSGNAQEKSFESLLYSAHQRANRILMSSANWNSKSIIDESFNLTRDDLSKSIQLANPYKIIYYRDHPDLRIYIRGHEQVLPLNDSLTTAIDKINNDDGHYRMGDFIEEFSTSITQRQAFVLLNDWCRKQAIVLR